MVLVAKDVVEKDFLTFSRDVIALDAAKRMKATHHGFAVVVGASGEPEGMVTEWDYLSKLVAEDRDPSKVKLAEIMTEGLVGVKADDGLDYVAQVMSEKGIRRVLVLREGKVIGVVTARMMLMRLKDYVDRVSTQIARLQTPKF
jgi:CBS domain-containing protein